MANFPVDKGTWQRLLRKVERKTNNNCDAEDFLQSAYLRFDNYRAEHPVNDPSAFLLRAARNIGIDSYRHQRRAINCLDKIEIEDVSPLQDEVIAARARLERVKEGLSRLSPETREVLLLRRLEGLGYDEIAERFGVSRSTVERTIARATAFLLDWTKDW